jgi:hypothetical protein
LRSFRVMSYFITVVVSRSITVATFKEWILFSLLYILLSWKYQYLIIIDAWIKYRRSFDVFIFIQVRLSFDFKLLTFGVVSNWKHYQNDNTAKNFNGFNVQWLVLTVIMVSAIIRLMLSAFKRSAISAK